MLESGWVLDQNVSSSARLPRQGLMARGVLNKKLVPIYYDGDLIWRLPTDRFMIKLAHLSSLFLNYACLI